MMQLVAIFIGGGLGSLARFGVGKLVSANFSGHFPLGTLSANVLSCVVMGLALGLFSDKVLADPWLKAFVVIGFCGGFSTFSTFSYETLELFRNGQAWFAAANVLVSVGFCVLLLFWMVRNS